MIRGWCPTVHAPMPTGDGLLVRVKPPGGRLPAPALAALAQAAADYGNGTIELTNRGNLQIRGVRDPAAFAAAMVAARLADPDPAREARRNVMPLPGCDDAVVAEAEAILADTPGLPPKFGVTVQGSTILFGTTPVTAADLKTRLTGPLPPWQAAGESDTAPQLPPDSYLLHLPNHQTTPAILAHLATLTLEIRTTPWRAFLATIPAAPGFSSHATAITTCPGAPACRSATTPTHAHAARLEAAGHTGIHLSGCAKGCAHPRATLTLTARDGRYDLIRHGRASDRPDRTGLTLTEAMAAL